MDEIELSVEELVGVTDICSELYDKMGNHYHKKTLELTYLIDKAKEIVMLAEKELDLINRKMNVPKTLKNKEIII